MISAAPIATGRKFGNGLVTPNRCATSITFLIPTRSASRRAGMLRDSAKASIRLILPA